MANSQSTGPAPFRPTMPKDGRSSGNPASPDGYFPIETCLIGGAARNALTVCRLAEGSADGRATLSKATAELVDTGEFWDLIVSYRRAIRRAHGNEYDAEQALIVLCSRLYLAGKAAEALNQPERNNETVSIGGDVCKALPPVMDSLQREETPAPPTARFTLSHPRLAEDGGGFPLYVLTDEYRRDDGGALDIRAGDTLIVRVGIETEQENCLLARFKDAPNGLMLLYEAGEVLRDLTDDAVVPREAVTVLGSLIEKRRKYWTHGDEELDGGSRYLHGDGSSELTGLAQMVVEEEFGGGSDNVLWPMSLLDNNEVFADLEAAFRKNFEWDPEAPGQWESREEAQSYALRLLCGRMLRAGQLAV